ncbi:bifunctional DNA-formamidopyrimidine glycosylase/DNA-(apurinic or apyrimidinic site) lyase [Alicyclobacillus ferrooxydans]|uniref:Formamidopyrimidine-DNA glycosylase n=1 Tax=Alicyclobacillus ferrooxydans TaxID=471514 RepID=A0A0P9GR87_9BACL|nr:bifunctional DNA-formamidopyrimidine glycosylase/DNA-(apurinic or apyrimidinic site) lyase [Alicyclobacillus ferrooxydans]KPV43441.1 formamidopyrimidine-DNA glycosylase [Alicyclobacillus ferrooxydans]
MPELPEMENYKRTLARAIQSRIVTNVEVNREKTVGVSAEEFARRVEGQRIVQIERRAKHIIFTLSSGDVLLLHLMLGGWMFYGQASERPDHQCQVVLSFGQDNLYFLGLRLGYLHLLTGNELTETLSKLGPEPFDPMLTPTSFHTLLTKTRGTLKTKLVNQHLIAGIGNCYSDEMCFAAGILPLSSTSSLEADDTTRLYHAMRRVLQDAIVAGGYMESPFASSDLLTGGYNDQCLVYDRGGEPCRSCGQPVVRAEHGGRKVFYCSHCQH